MIARWLQRFRRSPLTVADAEWRDLVQSSALLSTLAPEQLQRLREFAARFLADKRFHGAAGHVLEPWNCLVIAAMACLPVLSTGYSALRGWTDIVVYPGAFRSRREHHDEYTGVVTEMDEELIGEAWDVGPMVLSWADIDADLQQPFEGFNVVIHEVVHKLDLGDGAMNGTPALPSDLPRRHWNGTMQKSFEAFQSRVDAGEDVSIDPYAAECPEEFFAVCSEYHFSAPWLLSDCLPEVAALLELYFGRSPAQGLASAVPSVRA